MKRNYSIDLMRVFLCLCVITVHSLNHFGINNGYVNSFVSTFLLQANGAFFMLSGYFNLEKEFNSSSDIKKYYKNKVIYIVFPFLAFLFVWGIWDYVHINSSFDILDFLSTFYMTVMNDSAETHLWFMYPLFGLLLSTPFLSKLLHSMNEKELKIMWYVTLGWDAICYYLCTDMGVSFRFLNWFIDGWLIYYFAGYYYRHVISKESKLKWAILGILCYVLTNMGHLYLDTFVGTTDIQPMFVIFCVSCLMFWDKAIKINGEKKSKVITFISKHTFLIYMFHMRGIEFALRKFNIVNESLGDGLLVVLGAFVFSLIASYIANLLLKLVQKFLDKKWIIKESVY